MLHHFVGVKLKSEQKLDDMVDILVALQKYVSRLKQIIFLDLVVHVLLKVLR